MTLTLSRIINRIIVYTGSLIVIFFCVAPYLWLVISSVSKEKDLYQRPRLTWVPTDPTFDRIQALVTGGADGGSIGPSMARVAREFLSAFWNSFVVSSSTTIISVTIGALAAYAYSRFQFHGRQTLFGLSMMTRMLPPVSLAIPLYIILSSLGLIDTKTALIITYNFFLLPVAIWIIANYFESIPKELEDAARIDGCSHFGTFVRIFLPLSRPVIATVMILCFLMAWDEFFFALLFTQSAASKTLPKVISEFSTQFGGMDYGMVATGGMLASIIPVLIALILQRYIVSGLTSGAVKG